MSEHIDELLAEFDLDPVLADVVNNIIDEPIPESVKARLLKPLQPSKFKLRQVMDGKPRLPLTKEELTFFDDAPLPAKLDPEIYYTLVVDNAPSALPRRQLREVDTTIRKEIDEGVDGCRLDLRMVARGPDITDEGEVYWVSFENESLRVTKYVTTEVLEFLYADEQYKLFTVVGKAAK